MLNQVDKKRGDDHKVIRAVSRDEEGKKKVERAEVKSRNIDKIKYVEKKLMAKGVQRMERHPADGLGGVKKPPPKAGHGGKYTWEGPEDLAENELDAVPSAIDEKDPNYVEEVVEDDGLLVGEVEVAKAVEEKEGVARLEVDPHLKIN